MQLGEERVYGLRGVIELVRALMTREELDGGVLASPDHPILVVEGIRGAGKTMLLDRLSALLSEVPHAKVDVERNRNATVPELLSAIAFDLSRRYPKYELRFPRFITGQLVIGIELDLTDHARARGQVAEALDHHRHVDTVREVLVDTAGTILEGAGLPVSAPPSLVNLIVDGLWRRLPGKHLVLGDYRTWYGHRDLGLRSNPVDVLIDLNRWARSGDEDDQQRVDELMLAAFLADLRSEFDRGRRADERSLNGVVLLDNADTRVGRRFLSELARARRQRAVGEPGGSDPLTVVATSRGVVLNDVPENEVLRVDGSAPRPEEWLRHRWLGLRLPDLTEDEVDRAITDLGLTVPRGERLTRVVHGLTGGHPAATRAVLVAVAKRPPEKWVEPEAIVSRVEPGVPDAVAVEDEILDRLLIDISEAERCDLETCAPARHRDGALALAEHDDLLAAGRAGYAEVIDPVLWPEQDSPGLAALRRFLVRRLARRADPTAPTWSQVHGVLRALCRDAGDEAGELHHTLADGELGAVAARMHALLTELDSAAWSALLDAVVSAPRSSRPQAAPIDEVRDLVAGAEAGPGAETVARLVAALHVAADPFTDSRRRDVHLQIADDYAAVARLRPGGPHAVFLEASRHHRREAEVWD